MDDPSGSVGIGEANAGWRLEVHDVCHLAPAARVEVERWHSTCVINRLDDVERAVLVEVANAAQPVLKEVPRLMRHTSQGTMGGKGGWGSVFTRRGTSSRDRR
eukprot:COSAG02_NODE_1150_length_14208_cov_5.805231_7_plen_103_part_00